MAQLSGPLGFALPKPGTTIAHGPAWAPTSASAQPGCGYVWVSPITTIGALAARTPAARASAIRPSSLASTTRMLTRPSGSASFPNDSLLGAMMTSSSRSFIVCRRRHSTTGRIVSYRSVLRTTEIAGRSGVMGQLRGCLRCVLPGAGSQQSHQPLLDRIQQVSQAGSAVHPDHQAREAPLRPPAGPRRLVEIAVVQGV